MSIVSPIMALEFQGLNGFVFKQIKDGDRYECERKLLAK